MPRLFTSLAGYVKPPTTRTSIPICIFAELFVCSFVASVLLVISFLRNKRSVHVCCGLNSFFNYYLCVACVCGFLSYLSALPRARVKKYWGSVTINRQNILIFQSKCEARKFSPLGQRKPSGSPELPSKITHRASLCREGYITNYAKSRLSEG